MSNDMKLIMENWRKANEYQTLLKEQLLLESFLDSITQVAADVKDLFSTLGSLLKDPKQIYKFVNQLADKVINPAMQSIEETLDSLQKKFQDKESTDTTLVSSLVNKIRNSITKVYSFVRKIPTNSWKKAVSSVGLAVVLEFFSTKILSGIAAESTVEEIINYFNDEIMGFINDFLGDALVKTLDTAITGGVSTFVSTFSKIVNGTSFIASTLKPAIIPFQAGGITLSRLEESLR